MIGILSKYSYGFTIWFFASSCFNLPSCTKVQNWCHVKKTFQIMFILELLVVWFALIQNYHLLNVNLGLVMSLQLKTESEHNQNEKRTNGHLPINLNATRTQETTNVMSKTDLKTLMLVILVESIFVSAFWNFSLKISVSIFVPRVRLSERHKRTWGGLSGMKKV